MPKYSAGFLPTTQNAINNYLGLEVPPGPKFIPQYVMINFQKGGTLPFCLFLMYYFDNFSAPAHIYTAAHGSYGLVWLGKHFMFPDNKYNQKQTFMSCLCGFMLVLGKYWLAPYLLISRTAPEPSLPRCLAALVLYVLGVVLMMVADCYKYAQLKLMKASAASAPSAPYPVGPLPNTISPRSASGLRQRARSPSREAPASPTTPALHGHSSGGLISDGPFALVRHPNYTGEMMIYAAFALLVPHWIPWVVLAWVWLQLFLPNMLLKEASMSRHAGWDAYYNRTGMVLPPLSALWS
jgi:steroid 5-alpha reductase family enzyme